MAGLFETCTTSVNWMCGNKFITHNYDCHFGGTSAASPVASGIASLLLSKDSTLTAAMVYRILDSSAVPLTTTVPDTAYGYGRLDAFRAVLSISHGDANNDGVLSMGDLTAIVSYLTGGDFVPFPSVKMLDWNCSGTVDLGDMTFCAQYLSSGTPLPVNPCFKF